METPKNIVLYLEDIREIVEKLGSKITIKANGVKYKDIQEFEKKYYGKKIKSIRIETSTSEYVELTSWGGVVIRMDNRVKELETINYLFSKQPTIPPFIENKLSFIYWTGLIFSFLTIFSTTIFIENDTLKKYLYITALSVFILTMLIAFSQLLFPANYLHNVIVCKTSDDKTPFWKTKTFITILTVLLTAFVNWLFTLI